MARAGSCSLFLPPSTRCMRVQRGCEMLGDVRNRRYVGTVCVYGVSRQHATLPRLLRSGQRGDGGAHLLIPHQLIARGMNLGGPRESSQQTQCLNSESRASGILDPREFFRQISVGPNARSEGTACLISRYEISVTPEDQQVSIIYPLRNGA